MRGIVWATLAALGLAGVATGCSMGAAEESKGGIDNVRLINAGDDPANWITHGGTYAEQRFSPLTQVNRDNVGKLGLAWFADMDTARGQEATPLVLDGKLYVTTAWSKVFAFDAATGKRLWSYDPQVPGETGVKACCDVVNRGLAAWGDKLFLGTLDGRLVALDRATGEVISAETYVKVNWARGIDPATGRPVINPETHYGTDPVLVYPGPGGAHNWFPMGYSPRTKLAYVPAYQSGMVYALDPVTGEELWVHDPEVDKSVGVKACCDVVNRGVAVYDGKVYVGVIDGRLQALDAKTGDLVWEETTVDQSKPYTITGAPRIVKGNVLIGNGGAELGVRGYLSAYDAETGDLTWRFYTVPNPNKEPDNAASDAISRRGGVP